MLKLCGQPEVARRLGESRVRVGEIDIRLRSDVPDVLEDFGGLYREFRHAGQNENIIDIDVRQVRSGWIRRQYDVAGDGATLWSAQRVPEVLPYVEWGVNWRVIARRDDFLQLHAATLARGEEGLLLAADSGAGKSTLTAGLLARGWRYLSDEFALIHPATLQLHPFPKALCIKSGSFALMERLGLPLWRRHHYVKALKGAVAYLRPGDLGSDAISSPVNVRWIMLPQYRTGTPPQLYPISRAQAAFTLASHSFNRASFGAGATGMLTDMVRGAECWRLDCGSLEETCDLVESATRS